MIKRLSLGLLLFLSLATLLQAYTGTAKIHVQNIEGDITLSRNGEEATLAAGDTLEEADVVETKEDGLIDISRPDHWSYRLLGNSTCVLKKADAKTVKIEMIEGDIFSKVKNLKSDEIYEISTPAAVASVRGTEFWVRVVKDKNTSTSTFAVREGTVDVHLLASGDRLTLHAGEALDVPEPQRNTTPRDASTKELDDVQKATQSL